jgi:hypothetical protein
MARPAKKQPKKQAKAEEVKKPVKNDLIKKLSEVEAMSDDDKQAFRQNGGTTIQG